MWTDSSCGWILFSFSSSFCFLFLVASSLQFRSHRLTVLSVSFPHLSVLPFLFSPFHISPALWSSVVTSFFSFPSFLLAFSPLQVRVATKYLVPVTDTDMVIVLHSQQFLQTRQVPSSSRPTAAPCLQSQVSAPGVSHYPSLQSCRIDHECLHYHTSHE